ncbi:transmembrane and coiled-coil domain-containing protein 1 [Capsaspora owczarzaki ATCC 30864]|uniref:Transmembrane and coiled-coil domain-containing protein 1 n=1 Tax=Capsaspora owczarzaki (strain ATCC 30864) TaxID=595528 RepID=A0A0D2WR01_CAPO3|nr:transmembrane and coiled-coil domain-containing protein 1 [Capsaspora owczarzaki ATCC 30864]KJE93533.1 transmembrane and coiled-coil domain-containing protein 1 [Capsaspora owczarzaki ATCC 30864]|eukprot:XP_004348134.1 transmembrane and coiled-coil domain-containing protein 1 [Capsaspora owczarzaki ATCC 30864]
MSELFWKSLLVVAIAIASALLTEAITYFLLYRDEQYQTRKRELERAAQQVVAMKEFGSDQRSLEKKEEIVKKLGRDFATSKMRSSFALMFVFIGLMWLWNRVFDQTVMAKLPFEPISFIQGLTHRGLEGTDFTDCSFVFLYGLCSTSIRPHIQKLLGFDTSRAAAAYSGGMFTPPQQK